MTHPLLTQLGRDILIGSGAIGTCLRQQGGMAGDSVEMLNLQRPEAVTTLHREYKQAGSRILITNTFAANPLLLEDGGEADRCQSINRAGVRLAKEIAGSECMVWASVGPLSLGLRHDDFETDELVRLFSLQCQAVTDADALVLETFTDPREATTALTAAAVTGLPVIFQIGNIGAGRDRWKRIDLLLGVALDAKVFAVGTNCQHPDDIVKTVRYLAAHTSLPLTAAPNAGNPRIDRGLVTYDFSPKDLGDVGERLADAGAAVVGGCCGTTPDHIRRLASVIGGRKVVRPKQIDFPSERHVPVAGEVVRAENHIRKIMSASTFVVSVEIRADRRQSLDEIVSGAGKIADAGADLFDVPDNPGATVGRDAAVVASKLQEIAGIPSICHMSVTHSNLLHIHSRLIGCWDLGLRGILAITGDSPSMGHLGNLAKRVTDMKSSVELLRLVRTLRNGTMINGEEVRDAPDFCAGCATGRYSSGQMAWLRKKVDAGAEFVFSQPLFTLDDVKRLRDSISSLPVRFFPGVMPLMSRRNAEFFAGGRIPGITIPVELMESFCTMDSLSDQRRFGMERVTEFVEQLREEADGMYLIMPFGKNRYGETAEIVRFIKARAKER
ncbi:MAG: homocysteine S-methyltransferase family protein [Deltaproteobacteria bacterium]|nr:homocysteine S-methyltransferase family protein [Deltaproteobacteria bacterium]